MTRIAKYRFCSVVYLSSALFLVGIPGFGKAIGEERYERVEDEINSEFDPIEQRLIPPEFIVRHGHDIGLTGEQREEAAEQAKG